MLFYPGHGTNDDTPLMSESTGVVITTVLFVLVVVNIVGNSLVCAIIKRNRELRYVETDMIKKKWCLRR